MDQKDVKINCQVDPTVKLCCINVNCVNCVPVQWCCNLKNVAIDMEGRCSGFVKISKPKPPARKKKAINESKDT